MKDWNDAEARSDDIPQLVYLSNLIGGNLSLVQPGGGNTSVKLEEDDLFGCRVKTLVVKGSGTDLRTITPAGFTHLYLDRLAILREREEMSDEEMMRLMRACMLSADRDPVPSVETPLHSLIPHKFVAHTHDVATLSLTDTPSARKHIEQAFGDELAFLEYVRPGFPLAKRMAELFPDGPPKGTIGLAMEKHGLAVWGQTARECYERLIMIASRAEAYVAERQKTVPASSGRSSMTDGGDNERLQSAATLAPIVRGELTTIGWQPILIFDESPSTLAQIARQDFPKTASRGAMTPEHIMRAGRRPLVLQSTDAESLRSEIQAAHREYLAYAAKHHQPIPLPDWLKVVAVPGLGIFYAGKDRRNAQIARDCYNATMHVMANAESVERFQPISEADACEMEYWPLERRKIEASSAARKELDGKIALVIGGASGIGRATALRFAAEGAHLAVADLDLDRGEATAAEIGNDRAFAVAANAADPASVENAVHDAVLHFGGLDVLFYSPGVAPELHPVAEMSDAEVEQQLRVHYQGAVAATRAAARVMLDQATGGRLIYNASKAAYAPGEGAAAYGAAKAALVHYVRNAANELSRHGITSNYINADAVDTPLFGALVQERSRQTGQTEAETLQRYADRSLFRTATVPPEAVAEAALWLASDGSRYTSGCVITVGGGAEGMPR